MLTLSEIAAYLVGTGFIGATTAYAVVRWLGTRWLDAKFAERLESHKGALQRELESLKGAQQVELERIKFAINARMDRAAKLHQREFEVLPNAWSLLTDAFGIAMSLVSQLQVKTELDRMPQDRLEDFLANSELADFERKAVRESQNKTETYDRLLEPHLIARARKANQDFYFYFRKNAIFIREPIKVQFDKIDQLMQLAVSEHLVNYQHRTRERNWANKLADEGEKAVKALERDIQKVLWDSAHQD